MYTENNNHNLAKKRIAKRILVQTIIIGTTCFVAGSLITLYVRRNSIPSGVKIAVVSKEVNDRVKASGRVINQEYHVLTPTIEQIKKIIDDLNVENLDAIRALVFDNIK